MSSKKHKKNSDRLHSAASGGRTCSQNLQSNPQLRGCGGVVRRPPTPLPVFSLGCAVEEPALRIAPVRRGAPPVRRGGGTHPPVPFGLPPPPAAAAAGAPLPQLLRSFSFFELNPGNFLELRVYVTEKWHIERIIIERVS